jgi:geranylgeranyl transferase type-1 subunit beta
MALGFFILSALDLLSVPVEETERQNCITWIYHCQHPSGGFRGSANTIFGEEELNKSNQVWDAPNLAGTFFALFSLVVLGDNLEKVKRIEALEWLMRLQKEDGSFGEIIGEKGIIEGGADMRYCYMAMGVRWVLRGGLDNDIFDTKDIDVNKLVEFVISSEVRFIPANKSGGN